MQSLKGHTSSVNSLAFSPDSEWLASGSRDRTIKLWDIYEGKEVRTLEGHHGEVRAVTFSPDGQWLASASHDRTLKLWRVITGPRGRAAHRPHPRGHVGRLQPRRDIACFGQHRPHDKALGRGGWV